MAEAPEKKLNAEEESEERKGFNPITVVVVVLLVIIGVGYFAYTTMTEKKFTEAVRSGDAATVRAMLAKHPEFLVKEEEVKGSKERSGITILHRAAEHGHAEVVEVLVTQGARVNAAETKQGRTPLHLVVFAPDGKRVEAAKILIREHASLTAKDKDGKTPLDLAKENKKDDLVQLLSQPAGKATPRPADPKL